MRRPCAAKPGRLRGAGGAAARAILAPAAIDYHKPREVRLDPVTAELLEAGAKARGLTLVEYLTEVAGSEMPESEDLTGLKAGQS